jgi:hypothetical protein
MINNNLTRNDLMNNNLKINNNILTTTHSALPKEICFKRNCKKCVEINNRVKKIVSGNFKKNNYGKFKRRTYKKNKKLNKEDMPSFTNESVISFPNQPFINYRVRNVFRVENYVLVYKHIQDKVTITIKQKEGTSGTTVREVQAEDAYKQINANTQKISTKINTDVIKQMMKSTFTPAPEHNTIVSQTPVDRIRFITNTIGKNVVFPESIYGKSKEDVSSKEINTTNHRNTEPSLLDQIPERDVGGGHAVDTNNVIKKASQDLNDKKYERFKPLTSIRESVPSALVTDDLEEEEDFYDEDNTLDLIRTKSKEFYLKNNYGPNEYSAIADKLAKQIPKLIKIGYTESAFDPKDKNSAVYQEVLRVFTSSKRPTFIMVKDLDLSAFLVSDGNLVLREKHFISLSPS